MPTSAIGAALNIANGIREFAMASPNAVAVIDEDRQLTFAELDDRASRLANVLITRGVERGGRVAIMLGNRLEFCEIACGLAKAGLVSVPINPRSTAPEVAYILEHSEAQALIVEAHLDPTRTLASSAALVRTMLSLDGDYEECLASVRSDDPRVEVDETEPFTVAYTSGTTGRPKGVVISHRSRSLTFYAAALEWGLGPGRVTIAVAPMYHGAGFALAYAGCHTGGTVVMLRRWDPAHLLRLLESHRAGSIFLVPGPRADAARARRGGRSRATTCRPSPRYTPTRLRCRRSSRSGFSTRCHGSPLYEMYGSTEAGIVTCLRPADQLRKVRCVGPAWLMNEVRILLDAEGRPVATGEPGVLWSRSPLRLPRVPEGRRGDGGCHEP